MLATVRARGDKIFAHKAMIEDISLEGIEEQGVGILVVP